mgnify:CR=1 FL=1
MQVFTIMVHNTSGILEELNSWNLEIFFQGLGKLLEFCGNIFISCIKKSLQKHITHDCTSFYVSMYTQLQLLLLWQKILFIAWFLLIEQQNQIMQMNPCLSHQIPANIFSACTCLKPSTGSIVFKDILVKSRSRINILNILRSFPESHGHAKPLYQANHPIFRNYGVSRCRYFRIQQETG